VARWVMDAHAVMGSRMDNMSKFTGRLSFTIRYRLFDAQRAINRVGEELDIASTASYGQTDKTLGIIGIYDNKYKLPRRTSSIPAQT